LQDGAAQRGEQIKDGTELVSLLDTQHDKDKKGKAQGPIKLSEELTSLLNNTLGVGVKSEANSWVGGKPLSATMRWYEAQEKGCLQKPEVTKVS